MPGAFNGVTDVDLGLVDVPVVTHDETTSWSDSGILTLYERHPIRLRHVLEACSDEIVSPSVLPGPRIRHLEALFAIRKPLTGQSHQFRHEVNPMRPEGNTFLVRPCNQRLEQQAIGTPHVEEVAVSVNRLEEEPSSLDPPLSATAATRLLVRVIGIR
jgi:hypothetical protein